MAGTGNAGTSLDLGQASQSRRELPWPPEAWGLGVTLETCECQGHIRRPGRVRVSLPSLSLLMLL